ncbi:MAG: S8 family serine peptidase [Caldilineaceae bacterium]|nr:S8 family serine peptidase [Caldilineaceae bacterium]
MVKFGAGVSEVERDAFIAQIGGELVYWLAPLHTAQVRLSATSHRSVDVTRSIADASDLVISVENNGLVTGVPILVEGPTGRVGTAAQGTIPASPIQVNDPDFNNSMRVYAPALIDLTWAWRFSMGNPAIVLAVVDSGVNALHPDLNGRVLAGYDFVNKDDDPQDDHGHGTHIAGIIAAVANNGIGSAGICPLCSILPVKVLDASNTGTWANVAAGIVYAVDNGAHVINLSLGGSSNTQVIQDAISYAAAHGVLVVAAAGNSRSDDYFYPAALEDVLAVSATRQDDTRWSLSNFGDWIDVTAPGYAIFSTYHALDNFYNGYTFMSGTSMAAPHVVGLAGLLLSQQPARTSADLRRLILESATDLGEPGRDIYFGAGRINANKALLLEVPQPKANAMVGGVIWQDENINGAWEEDEVACSFSILISVFSQDDQLVAAVTVDGDGEWRVGNLYAGVYQVKAEAQDQAILTTPSQYVVTLAESQSIFDLNFGAAPLEMPQSQERLYLPMLSR